MKKVFLACALALGTVAVTQAQDSTATESNNYATTEQPAAAPADDQGGDKQIAAADLPAPIQEKLKGSDYSGWTVGSAKTKTKDGKTHYAVELKNGAETKKVVFDEQGNIVKEK